MHLSNDKLGKIDNTSGGKSGSGQTKPVWYIPYSSKDLFGMDDVKILLNKSFYHVMMDMLEITRLHLGVRKELLLSPSEGIRVQGDPVGGWVVFPGESLLNFLGTAYVSQNDVRVPKRCHVGIHSVAQDGSLRYISSKHAKLSLMFHLLFNIQSKQITHWCCTHLQGRPELILLAQLSPKRYCSDLVCAIFRDGGPDGAINYKVFNDGENAFMRAELARTGWRGRDGIKG